MAPRSLALPEYDTRNTSPLQRHLDALPSDGARLGCDPFAESRLDDATHLVLVPSVDRHGAYRRDDHARAVLVTVGVLVGGAAGLGVLYAILRVLT